MVQISAAVPAFGGMYFDQDGQLVVSLTDATKRDAALAAIKPVLGESRKGALTGVKIRPVRYAFSQLHQWRDRVNPEVFSLKGISFTDVDERTNRVIIAVENDVALARVTAAVKRLGLPADAVSIEQHAPYRTQQTLTSYRRPPQAGMQIAFGNFFCTAGFSASNVGMWDGNSYFVTNSHCTNVRGTVEGTQYYQPTVSVSSVNHIGVEVSDPPFFTGGACPVGRRCRYSDAALVHYDQPWTGADGYGAVARTTSFGHYLGSSTLYSPDYYMVGGFNGHEQPWVSAPFVGMQIDKVGRTTGWTRGAVTNTCVDIPLSPDITMLCQNLVDAGVGPGDSGSPVFQSNGRPNDNSIGNSYVTLYGLLWGGNDPGTSFVYSPLPNIEMELGIFYYCYC